MSDVSLPETPGVPGLETFPVAGEPGAITLQAGHVLNSSRLLADQGQQVTALAASLAPD